jgi:hypothetical protein
VYRFTFLSVIIGEQTKHVPAQGHATATPSGRWNDCSFSAIFPEKLTIRPLDTMGKE